MISNEATSRKPGASKHWWWAALLIGAGALVEECLPWFEAATVAVENGDDLPPLPRAVRNVSIDMGPKQK